MKTVCIYIYIELHIYIYIHMYRLITMTIPAPGIMDCCIAHCSISGVEGSSLDSTSPRCHGLRFWEWTRRIFSAGNASHLTAGGVSNFSPDTTRNMEHSWNRMPGNRGITRITQPLHPKKSLVDPSDMVSHHCSSNFDSKQGWKIPQWRVCRWRQLGFQSSDPRTDLRTGILAPLGILLRRLELDFWDCWVHFWDFQQDLMLDFHGFHAENWDFHGFHAGFIPLKPGFHHETLVSEDPWDPMRSIVAWPQ